MNTTANLALPYIMPAQAQKHVTHNEAIRTLDSLVQLGVLDRDLVNPPAAPADGSRYIVGASASGGWSGHSGQIAAFQDGAWSFHSPREGWLAWVADEDRLVAWDGAAWIVAGGGAVSLNPADLVGIHATADTANRLAVSSPATLLSHEGSGHQLKINKATAADTGSALFQTGFSGRAEMGLTGDDNYHIKVSADGTTWREALVIDRASGSVALPNTPVAAAAGTSAVLNPGLPRAWAKCASMLLGETAARLNVVALGDSVMPLLREILDARLKIEFVNGGFAGRLAGENGFLDDGNGTGCTQIMGDFVNSPNGIYWSLTAGGSKYFEAGNVTNLQPLSAVNPSVFVAPANVTRIGIYFVRRSAGGTFKVQTSTKGAGFATYTDVPGLTAVATSGATAVQYLEVTIPATDVRRLRIVHVSGGDCFVLGALAAADKGVVMHSWNAGGTSMTDQVNSPRFAELAALIPADVVITSFLDAPGDATTLPGNASLTLPQLIDGILNPLRAAFPATIVPASTTAWAGKTALIAQKPHFVFFGGNKVEAPGALDQNAYNAAIRANAAASGDCYVDTAALWGNWRKAYDLGVMSGGDGAGQSTHPAASFYGAVATAFLREAGLIGGAFARPPAQQTLEKLQVGAVAPGQYNPLNAFKAGDATTQFSAGPVDVLGFGNLAAGIRSSGTVYECGMVFQSVAVNGRTYITSSQPGGGFVFLDTSFGVFFQFNAAKQLSLAGSMAGASVQIGPNGQYLSGLRHGVATLVAGVATVTDSKATVNSRVVVTRAARGGTPGVCYEAIPGAGSFIIRGRTSADAVASADTSTIAYTIVEP